METLLKSTSWYFKRKTSKFTYINRQWCWWHFPHDGDNIRQRKFGGFFGLENLQRGTRESQPLNEKINVWKIIWFCEYRGPNCTFSIFFYLIKNCGWQNLAGNQKKWNWICILVFVIATWANRENYTVIFSIKILKIQQRKIENFLKIPLF